MALKGFVNKYILKAYLFMLLLEALGIICGIVGEKISVHSMNDIASWPFIGGFILQFVLWVITLLFLMFGILNSDAKRVYVWSVVFVLGSLVEYAVVICVIGESC